MLRKCSYRANFWKPIVTTARAICGVKPEHSKVKPYGNA
jgi:hypothetical protein